VTGRSARFGRFTDLDFIAACCELDHANRKLSGEDRRRPTGYHLGRRWRRPAVPDDRRRDTMYHATFQVEFRKSAAKVGGREYVRVHGEEKFKGE
jgi:hypothetical protein